MVTHAQHSEQTWRYLWTHLAHEIVSTVGSSACCEVVSVGYAWGLRNRRDPRRALLLHPSSNEQAVGDLALTVVGLGTQPIPRYHRSLVTYIDVVKEVVETASRVYVGTNQSVTDRILHLERNRP
jgi:hypothetical protein